MARKRDTGEGDPYSDEEEARVADELEAALAAEDDPEADYATIDIEAQIEWAGTIDNNGRDGIRRTLLDDVPMVGIRAAAGELERARAAGPLQPFKSYRAKSWRAQLRQMNRTKRGREAVEAAGINPATMRRWQSGRQRPSAESQRRVAEAYGAFGDPRAAAVRAAQHNVAEALTGAARARYGVNVRFRNIVTMFIRDR